MIILNNFGKKIDNLMEKNGIKYATEIASQIDVSADVINTWRKKDIAKGVEVIKLNELANYFGVPLDYFFSNDKQDNNITADNCKYININNIDKINIEELMKEVKFAVKSCDLEYKNSVINEKKNYIEDGLDIIVKLVENNL